MAVFDEDTQTMMEIRELIRHEDPHIRAKWHTVLANGIGMVMNGIKDIIKEPTNNSALNSVKLCRYISRYFVRYFEITAEKP